MLKRPNKFLPIKTEPGFQADVATDGSGDFHVKEGRSGDLYLNPFDRGYRFFRTTVSDALVGPQRLEEVTDPLLLKNLREAKLTYIRENL
jgi:hypothetical protein